jgi:hypothetical protein
MPDVRMVRLLSTRDAFEAKLIAARLGADGVLCQLRGGVDGMYPVGVVHVYVEEDAVELARALVAEEAAEGDSDGDGDGDGDGDELDADRPARPQLALWLVVLGIVAMIAWSVARVVMT